MARSPRAPAPTHRNEVLRRSESYRSGAAGGHGPLSHEPARGVETSREPARRVQRKPTVKVVPDRGIDEVTARQLEGELDRETDASRKALLEGAKTGLASGRSVFASVQTAHVATSSVPQGGGSYTVAFEITVDPNAVIVYEEPGSFGAVDPDEDLRKGSAQDLSQAQYGTTLREHERSHAKAARLTGTAAFVEQVLNGTFSFQAKAPQQPIISTVHTAFSGPMVNVHGPVKIPTSVQVSGGGANVPADIQKIAQKVGGPLQAYLASVQEDVLKLVGHGEDYMPADERGYDASGTPIAFEKPPTLPTSV